jgi:hypothetical protein
MAHQPDNIFAGTQVVSLVEVRGTNKSLVHPRGAVGVVTRTPTGDQHQFLVRFPDGFEASLTREQLDVLKHFKDRLGDCSGVVSAPPESATVTDRRYSGFHLEQFIIYRCVVGSRASGLDNDEFDTDRRGQAMLASQLLGAGPACLEETAESKLPERPDYEAANRFLIKARREMANLNPL